MGFITFNPQDTKMNAKKFTLCVSASDWTVHAQVKFKAVKIYITSLCLLHGSWAASLHLPALRFTLALEDCSKVSASRHTGVVGANADSPGSALKI